MKSCLAALQEQPISSAEPQCSRRRQLLGLASLSLMPLVSQGVVEVQSADASEAAAPAIGELANRIAIDFVKG